MTMASTRMLPRAARGADQPGRPDRRTVLAGAGALAIAPWLAHPAVAAATAAATPVTAAGDGTGAGAAAKPGPDIPLPPLGSTIELPDLTLLDGSVVDAAARQGRTTVLYWWASWCPFCAEQSPLIDKLWRDERDNGLLVLGLSIDRQARTAADHLKRKGYQFPSAWLSPALAQRLPKPKGLPVTIVLDAEGKVLAAESGQMFAEDVAELGRWAPGRSRSTGS